jgi:cell division protein FtsQ
VSEAARTRTDPRISRRRRAVARGQRRRAVVRISAVAGLCLALWAAFFSPLLAVREVKLSGAEHTRVSDVQAASGLDTSDNLLLLSASDVASRIETLPWVKRAEVDRNLPGTVKVSIVERRAAVVLVLGEERFVVDEDARVLEMVEEGPGLPVLAGPRLPAPEPGERLSSVELTSALRAFSTLPPRLRRDVQAVFAPTVERITFQLSDGIQVRYGPAADMVSKNEVLVLLLERLRSEGQTASYVDVRVPEAPAVAPLPAGEIEPGDEGSP